MSIKTVQLEWLEGQRFLLKDRAGYPILMAQPDGVSAADLLPLGLVGCSSWDVIAILRKQRQQVARFRAYAESTQDDEPPWRFRQIRIRYQVWGANLNPARIRRAIDLAETNYCSVHSTLRQAVDIASDFEIIVEQPGSAPAGTAARDGSATPLEIVHRFNAAFNHHDVGALMALMTEDCVFENTYPPPDGERFVGQAAVRAAFERFFRQSPHAAFEFGDPFATTDRVCVLWTYRWTEADGRPGHVRGVDVFRIQDGKVAEKLSYVKG